MAGFDVSQLATAYGAKYADGSKDLQDLNQRLYHTAKFDQLFQLEYTRLTVYEKGNTDITEVTQPFQLGWTAKGTLEFTPSRSTLDRVKIDWQGSSHELWASWVQFLRQEGVQEADQTKLLDYVLDLIIKKHVEEMELQANFKGVLAAPTPGSAGAAANAINGVRKRLNDAVTAGTISPISTGALHSDPVDFVGQVEAYVEQIDSLDRSSDMTIAMAPEQYSKWRRGMRTKYNQQHLQVAELDQLIDYPHLKVAGFEAMRGSSIIWCTPKGNAIKAVNIYDTTNTNKTVFGFEQQDRQMKIWRDYAVAYHFNRHDRVYMNDQTV